MARFYTYAEILTPDHIQWEVHARGLGCGRQPGLVLPEVLDRNGGRYETTMPMSDGIREQARVCAQASGDEQMARIAGLSEVSCGGYTALMPGSCGFVRRAVVVVAAGTLACVVPGPAASGDVHGDRTAHAAAEAIRSAA